MPERARSSKSFTSGVYPAGRDSSSHRATDRLGRAIADCRGRGDPFAHVHVVAVVLQVDGQPRGVLLRLRCCCRAVPTVVPGAIPGGDSGGDSGGGSRGGVMAQLMRLGPASGSDQRSISHCPARGMQRREGQRGGGDARRRLAVPIEATCRLLQSLKGPGESQSTSWAQPRSQAAASCVSAWRKVVEQCTPAARWPRMPPAPGQRAGGGGSGTTASIARSLLAGETSTGQLDGIINAVARRVQAQLVLAGFHRARIRNATDRTSPALRSNAPFRAIYRRGTNLPAGASV